MGCGSSTASEVRVVRAQNQFSPKTVPESMPPTPNYSEYAEGSTIPKKNSGQSEDFNSKPPTPPVQINHQTSQVAQPNQIIHSSTEITKKKSLASAILSDQAPQVNKPTQLAAPSAGSQENPTKSIPPSAFNNQEPKVDKPNQPATSSAVLINDKQANNKAFALNNAAAFQSDGKRSKPINYASATINDETFAILNSMKDSNEMADILAGLYNPGKSFSFTGLDDAYVKKLSDEYAILCDKALDEMCSAQDFKSRVKWQTCFLHLIQATYQSQFGDFAFAKIKKKADALREKHPIGTKEVDTTLEGLNGIDYPKGNKDAKLWDFLDFLHDDKYEITRKDLEYITRNGEVSVPSEIGAVADVCNYVQTIKTPFYEDLKKIFTRSKEFKSNTKGLRRAVFKMDEYAAKKPRPSFNYIWDLVRCKAVYENIQSLREDFKALISQYKVIQVKDKLQTALKNLTINIVYDKVIAEVQMVYGEVIGEYSNHKIYEVYRCESIQEVHNTVLAWSDYRFEEFKPLCGAILPTRSLESQTFRGVVQRMKFPVMKSKEYGVFTREPVSISEDNYGYMGFVALHRLKCHYDSNNIYGITLQDTDQIKSGVQVLSKILKDGNFIKNVTGSYDRKSGIKKLVLHLLSGETITIGQSVPDEITFDVKIPKHCVVLGFGYRGSERSGIQSLYCWFGLIPLAEPQVMEVVLHATTNYGLPFKCKDCTRQLLWYPNQDDELNCSKCYKLIPIGSGAAKCFKDSYSLCSSCLYQENSALLPLPNPSKITCNNSHELKWQYNRQDNSNFNCSGCGKRYSSTTGSYTCPCNVHFCSGCCQEKGDFANIPVIPTFPTVSTDLPCGKCNRSLIWYWHTKLCSYPEGGYGCNVCMANYPESSGGFHCDKCNYDVCSKCYYDSGQSDVSTMPNFRNKVCTKGLYLTWQFSLSQPWECWTCHITFPGGSGCYACPSQNCDGYKECSGCYLAGVISSFTYDQLQTDFISEDMVTLIAPFGQYKSGLDCFECGRDLIWLWDRQWAVFGQNPGTPPIETYFCNVHRGHVSCKAGGFYCLNCDYDLCSICYKEEKETNLTSIPNLSRQRCPKGTLLSWNYDLPTDWSCHECHTTFKDPLAGYTCSKKGSSCCSNYNVCPTCFIKTCQVDREQYLQNYYAILNGQQTSGGASTNKPKISKCGSCKGLLKWHWDTIEAGENYADGAWCNNCEGHIPHNAGVYNCANCGFDSCSTCYVPPPEKNDKTQFEINRLCPYKKKLVWKPSAGDNWSCDACMTQMPPNTGYFACEDPTSCECGGYAECASCTHPSEKTTQKKNNDRPDCTKCGSCGGHLKWNWDTQDINFNYTNGACCNFCNQDVPHNAGVYNCSSCGFDVCSSCFVNPDSNQFKSQKTCPNQNELVWRPSAGDNWSCDVCVTQMPSHTGLYACNDPGSCGCGGYAECSSCGRPC